jgi:hypothetical protein
MKLESGSRHSRSLKYDYLNSSNSFYCAPHGAPEKISTSCVNSGVLSALHRHADFSPHMFPTTSNSALVLEAPTTSTSASIHSPSSI